MGTPGSQLGCTLTFEIGAPAEIALQVAVARRAGLDVDDRITVHSGGAEILPVEVPGDHGGLLHLVRAEPGELSIRYEAMVRSAGEHLPVALTPLERIAALRPSRYCPSDRLAGFARREFGGPGGPLEKVRTICDYVNRHISYQSGTSGPTTDGADTLLSGQGVCRDFAHLVAALCRAVEVPARVVAVYAPGLSPMDFHAVVETEIDGVWRIWDATRLAPRQSLVRIATGADAADTAFATVLSGLAELTLMEVFAVAGGDLPIDTLDSLVPLV